MQAPASLRIQEKVAIVTLQAAERGNALDYTMAEALVSLVAQAGANPETRCLLIAAEGRNFSVGGNLDAADPADPQTGDRLRRMLTALKELLIALAIAPFPVVASVNGVAAGAGFGLALAADYLLAGASARFVTAFGKIGLSPDTGVSFQLGRRLDPATALDLALNSPTLTAPTAQSLKLVWRVFDDGLLQTEAETFASRLADGPTVAFAATRKLMGVEPAALGRRLDEEAASVLRLIETADYAEGIAAFRERRPAKFNGR